MLNLSFPVCCCLFFPSSPTVFTPFLHPLYKSSLSPSLPLCPCFSSLHQDCRPMAVPGFRKWMVCLFLEPRKEGKPKVSWGERGRVEDDDEEEGEEGCEEMINLHSTAASGQRQLEPQSTLEERQHHWLERASEIEAPHAQLQNNNNNNKGRKGVH